MAFYAGRVVLQPQMQNPTLVILTDRNDLDEQLFTTFSRCKALLRQNPERARDRAHVRELLNVAAGGVVFTTIQKFMPESKGDTFPLLSDRTNIVVIADEAHRSQYDFIDGFARHMRDALPNASFIGFTGTPVEATDKNTRAVFGDYISVYDIQRAVQDGATVPIYYESRLAKLQLDESQRPHLDERFEEVTEGEEEGGKDVCMSRRICVDLYDAIVARRPSWHSDDDAAGAIKVVMTGSASDPTAWQGHIRSKSRRETLAKRLRDVDDPLQIVLVRDMWLTGFDAPCLHTMYVDKPMQGHGLMQAIARVNRVFRDKPGGLVVDYLGLADQLERALLRSAPRVRLESRAPRHGGASSGEVIDIFAAAGVRNPDIGILSDEFLAEVAEMKHRNLAVELLQKLLRDELKLRSKHNLVQSRSFSEMLDKCYQAAQIMVMRSRWTMAIATADVRDARVRGGDGHRYRARVV